MKRLLLFILLSLPAISAEIKLSSKSIKLPDEWVIKESKALMKQHMTLIFHKEEKSLLGRMIILDVAKSKGLSKNCPQDGEIIAKKVCLVFIKDKKNPKKNMPFIHFIYTDKKKVQEVTLAFDKTENKKIYKELAKYLGSKI